LACGRHEKDASAVVYRVIGSSAAAAKLKPLIAGIDELKGTCDGLKVERTSSCLNYYRKELLCVRLNEQRNKQFKAFITITVLMTN